MSGQQPRKDWTRIQKRASFLNCVPLAILICMLLAAAAAYGSLGYYGSLALALTGMLLYLLLLRWARGSLPQRYPVLMSQGDEAEVDEGDAVLVEGIMDKNAEAFRQAIGQYGPKVKGYLQTIFGLWLGRKDVDRVFRVACLKLWHNAQAVDLSKAHLGVWFLMMAHNSALDYLRAKGTLKNTLEGVFLEYARKGDGNANDFYAALEGLSDDERKVMEADLNTDLVEGITSGNQDLAKKLGVNTAAVELLREKALASLRDRLGLPQPKKKKSS